MGAICASSPTSADASGSDEPTKIAGAGIQQNGNHKEDVAPEAPAAVEANAADPEKQKADAEAAEAARKEAELAEQKAKEEEEARKREEAEQKEKEEAEKEERQRKEKEEAEKRKKEEMEKKKVADAEKKKKAAEDKKKKEEEELKKKKAAEEKKKKDDEMKKLLGEAGEHMCKAATNGKTKRIKDLLEANANPDEQDGKGRRPLQVAIAEGNMEIMKMLLGAKADPNVEGKGIQTGPTYPLHVAAREGSAAMATMLLEAGANTETKNQRNQTAEVIAEGKKNTDFLKAVRAFKEKK